MSRPLSNQRTKQYFKDNKSDIKYHLDSEIEYFHGIKLFICERTRRPYFVIILDDDYPETSTRAINNICNRIPAALGSYDTSVYDQMNVNITLNDMAGFVLVRKRHYGGYRKLWWPSSVVKREDEYAS
ncbi:hypothetical protein F4819DRAFT_489589 [Hypoxylon fuscum]|nr:hypothetical protein F4819DRAFT_489589 [Hypoxylon fuscum]